MNTGGLLDQLLKAGSGMLGGQSGSSTQASQNSGGGNSQLGSLLSGAAASGSHSGKYQA